MLKRDFINYVYHNNIIQLGTTTFKNGAYSDHYYNFGMANTPNTLLQLSKWLVDAVVDLEFDSIFTSAYKGITIQTGFALEYGYQFPFKTFKFGYQRLRRGIDLDKECDIEGHCPQKGDRVLLLDDVFTTGYSLGEMAKLVGSYGAVPVSVVVPILRADNLTVDRFKERTGIDEVRYLVHDDEIIQVYKKYRI